MATQNLASLLRFELRNLSTIAPLPEAGVNIAQHTPLEASVFNPLLVLYLIVQNISVSVTNASFNCHIRACYGEGPVSSQNFQFHKIPLLFPGG